MRSFLLASASALFFAVLEGPKALKPSWTDETQVSRAARPSATPRYKAEDSLPRVHGSTAFFSSRSHPRANQRSRSATVSCKDLSYPHSKTAASSHGFSTDTETHSKPRSTAGSRQKASPQDSSKAAPSNDFDNADTETDSGDSCPTGNYKTASCSDPTKAAPINVSNSDINTSSGPSSSTNRRKMLFSADVTKTGLMNDFPPMTETHSASSSPAGSRQKASLQDPSKAAHNNDLDSDTETSRGPNKSTGSCNKLFSSDLANAESSNDFQSNIETHYKSSSSAGSCKVLPSRHMKTAASGDFDAKSETTGGPSSLAGSRKTFSFANLKKAALNDEFDAAMFMQRKWESYPKLVDFDEREKKLLVLVVVYCDDPESHIIVADGNGRWYSVAQDRPADVPFEGCFPRPRIAVYAVYDVADPSAFDRCNINSRHEMSDLIHRFVLPEIQEKLGCSEAEAVRAASWHGLLVVAEMVADDGTVYFYAVTPERKGFFLPFSRDPTKGRTVVCSAPKHLLHYKQSVLWTLRGLPFSTEDLQQRIMNDTASVVVVKLGSASTGKEQNAQAINKEGRDEGRFPPASKSCDKPSHEEWWATPKSIMLYDLSQGKKVPINMRVVSYFNGNRILVRDCGGRWWDRSTGLRVPEPDMKKTGMVGAVEDHNGDMFKVEALNMSQWLAVAEWFKFPRDDRCAALLGGFIHDGTPVVFSRAPDDPDLAQQPPKASAVRPDPLYVIVPEKLKNEFMSSWFGGGCMAQRELEPGATRYHILTLELGALSPEFPYIEAMLAKSTAACDPPEITAGTLSEPFALDCKVGPAVRYCNYYPLAVFAETGDMLAVADKDGGFWDVRLRRKLVGPPYVLPGYKTLYRRCRQTLTSVALSKHYWCP